MDYGSCRRERLYYANDKRNGTSIVFFGKKYVSVELEDENKYEVSGNTLKYFFDMIDQGDINEAENLLLEDLDYTNKEEVMAAAFFYQHLSQKDDDFLRRNDYTKEEVLFGFKQLLEKSGYKDLIRLIGRVDEEER